MIQKPASRRSIRTIVAVAARLISALRQKPCQARRTLKNRNEITAVSPRGGSAPPTSSRMIRPSSSATTRLRSAVTTSALWVAIRTVTPSSLIRRSSCRISQLISGSRLPVGSSAMMSRGSWTSARAMAVRCCSPPESWFGHLAGLRRQPDEREHPVDGGPDLPARRAGDLEREGDVLPDRLGRQQLEVLEDDADLAAHRAAPGGAAGGRGPRRRGRPRRCVASSSRIRSLISVDLPAPDGPDEEDEVALRDHEVDVPQRDLAVGVPLGDVVQHEDRPIRRRAWSRPRSRMRRRSRARRRGRGGDGHAATPCVAWDDERPPPTRGRLDSDPRARQGEPRRSRGYHPGP